MPIYKIAVYDYSEYTQVFLEHETNFTNDEFIDMYNNAINTQVENGSPILNFRKLIKTMCDEYGFNEVEAQFSIWNRSCYKQPISDKLREKSKDQDFITYHPTVNEKSDHSDLDQKEYSKKKKKKDKDKKGKKKKDKDKKKKKK